VDLERRADQLGALPHAANPAADRVPGVEAPSVVTDGEDHVTIVGLQAELSELAA
jgi:hypothetical protein